MATTTPNFGLRKPTNADTVNVATDISGNMDLIDAHAHSGTYGRVFPVAAYATIHAAYDALVAAGGGTLEVRGTIPVATDFLLDAAVPCLIDGYGGTLQPAAGVVALGLEVGSSGVPVVSAMGITIDGTTGGGSGGGTVGIRIKSNLSSVLRDVQVNHCGTGVLITDDPLAWSESSSLDAVTIDGCLVGVDFANGGGTSSFGYMAWGRVAIYNVPSGGVGFRVGANCPLPHFDLAMLVIQTTAALVGGETATLMEIGGAVGRNARWHVVLESSGGAYSGTRNGVSLLSTGVMDGLGLRIYWQGTFTNKILNPSAIAYQLREATDRDLRGNTNVQNLQTYGVFGDANPRMVARADRLMFGDGTSTPDSAIVRWGGSQIGCDTGDSWRVDGTWNGGNLRFGSNWIWLDGSGNLRTKTSAPSSDTDGTLLFAPLAGPFAPSSTGAVSATRYVGGTAAVAPTTGTFAVGDFVITQTGLIYICTSAGTPGTWTLANTSLIGALTSTNLQAFSVTGDANPRMVFRAGRIMLGDGTSATLDSQIVRWGVNLLGADTGDSWQVDGTWNGGLLRLGSYRVWVDAAGNLRTKSSDPSSDTDGTVYQAAAPGYVTANYYGPAGAATALKAFTADQLFVVPYFVRSAATFDRIAIETTTAGGAGTLYRLGIWNHNPLTGKAGTLVLDAGTVAGDAVAGAQAATISQALTVGWYWLGVAGQVLTGSPALRAFSGGSPLLSSSASGTAMGVTAGYVVTGISGALASLAAASFGSSSTAPVILLRAT